MTDRTDNILRQALSEERLGEAVLLRLADIHAGHPDRCWKLGVLAELERAMATAIAEHLGVAAEPAREAQVDEAIARGRLGDWRALLAVIPEAADHAIRGYRPLLGTGAHQLGKSLIAHECALKRFAEVESGTCNACSVADALAMLPTSLRAALIAGRPRKP